jgi:ABC-2 type transport system ATP-binding protein
LRDELGLTVMLSSHLLHEVEQVCNRVAIIDEGRLLYQGPVEDLIAQDSWTRLRVDRIIEAYELLSGNPQLSVSHNGDESLHLKIAEEEIPGVNALLVEHGFQVMELSPQRKSLEQVFLRLTEEARKHTNKTSA